MQSRAPACGPLMELVAPRKRESVTWCKCHNVSGNGTGVFGNDGLERICTHIGVWHIAYATWMWPEISWVSRQLDRAERGGAAAGPEDRRSPGLAPGWHARAAGTPQTQTHRPLGRPARGRPAGSALTRQSPDRAMS
jgi:hypothetical protein